MPPEPQHGSPDPIASLQPGWLVGAGRFNLIRLLGRGGMGVVWLARDESLREDIALKFLPPEIQFDAVALDDLRRETSRSRKLTHPNIIRIYDLYRDEHHAFISMEYVDGPNLSDLRIAQGDRVFSWSFVEPLLRQLCDALEYAHGEGVIHRDLKPANMMLDSRGRLKLSDFGIAAVVTDSASRIAWRHATSGTVTHMSPQQMDGHAPQVSDDIYALGATIYELLTSRPPFYRGDIGHQVRNNAVPPIAERLAELGLENKIPPAVAAMVMACLSKDPGQRPPGAGAIAEWLGFKPVTQTSTPAEDSTTKQEPPIRADRVIAPPPETREPVSKPNDKPAHSAAVAQETIHTAERPTSRRLIRPLALSLLALLLCAGAWWFFARPHVTSSSSSSSAANKAPELAARSSVESAGTALSAPDAEGWTSLFNGRDLAGWAGDPNIWTVSNGTICGKITQRTRADEPSCLIWRGEQFDNFELRFSFRLARGNSGIYYRAAELAGFDVGGYQFEIGSGGPGNLLDVGNDRARRDLKRLGNVVGDAHGWIEGRIIANGSHITHVANNRVLFDLEDTASSAPRRGVLALEATAGPATIYFKEISIRKLPLPSSAATPPRPIASSDWITLFDGSSLAAWQGWRGYEWSRSWSVVNGELTSIRGVNVDLASRDLFANFELEFEWKVTPGANGGVLYRANGDAAEPWQTAPEYQVIDDLQNRDGRVDLTSTASLFGIAGLKEKPLRAVGEFNAGRIIAQGRHIEHWLNGVKIVDVNLSDPDVQRRAFARFRKAMWGEAARGQIVLQHLGYKVSYRNIRIRRLPD